jgi:predicted LPLAT superfamily acyltransferase
LNPPWNSSAALPVEALEPAPARSPDVRWSGRTRGGYFGNWFFVQVIRRLGVRWAYAWLAFVAAYFTLAAPRSFRCSVDYLKRVVGPQPGWKWPVLVYRHFFSFGFTLLDRLAVIMGRGRIECRFEGEALFREYVEQGKGVILLGAHLGSWEIGGHLLGRLGKPVNIVVLEREQERVRRLFERALETKQFRLLTTDERPLRSIPILAALRRGEIVALHGDRSFGGADLALPFLGGTARFPVGPFLLAAASGAPLFQVFVVRERLGHYRFFSYPAKFIPRELLRANPEALREHVSEYAQRLATAARQYPFQWYNIYPFWEAPANASGSSALTATMK